MFDFRYLFRASSIICSLLIPSSSQGISLIVFQLVSIFCDTIVFWIHFILYPSLFLDSGAENPAYIPNGDLELEKCVFSFIIR